VWRSNQPTAGLREAIKQTKHKIGESDSDAEKAKLEREIAVKEKRIERISGILKSAVVSDQSD
jgi:hypothetical protein